MLKKTFYIFVATFIVLTSCFPKIALAYVGPGTGLSAIGAFLALLVAIIATILGFLWYPIKRLLGIKKRQEPDRIKSEEK